MRHAISNFRYRMCYSSWALITLQKLYQMKTKSTKRKQAATLTQPCEKKQQQLQQTKYNNKFFSILTSKQNYNSYGFLVYGRRCRC